MKYTDLIFDLYGTLVDIHTEETDLVWEKTALFFGYYGAAYTGQSLKAAFQKAMAARHAQATYGYECFPDIPMEEIFATLLREKGIREDADRLGIQGARLFRISSTEYIRLYPGVQEALNTLREKGYRLWLLSNAQAVFTRCELKHLGLTDAFHGIYLSSDYGCRKPDRRFFQSLLKEQSLEPSRCLMIGNDLDTDIAGAEKAGLATLYLHTNLTPGTQRPADPACALGTPGPHWEQEGPDLSELIRFLPNLRQNA